MISVPVFVLQILPVIVAHSTYNFAKLQAPKIAGPGAVAPPLVFIKIMILLKYKVYKYRNILSLKYQ